MDSLADCGTLFLNAQSQAPWTLPAFATILTGLYPQQHGAGQFEGQLYGLEGDLPFLPEIMAEAGYHTYGDFAIPWLGPDFGFDRGWDRSIVHTERALHGYLHQTVPQFEDWVGTIPGDEPFFAVVHVFEMHGPYDPAPPYDTMFLPDSLSDRARISTFTLGGDGRPSNPEEAPYLSAQYDGEIRMADDGISELMAFLRRTGRDSQTVVILTADHGDEFMERGGCDHGHTLYQELVHIPLVMSGPGIPGGEVVPGLVGQIDLAPTILTLASIPVPEELPGMDILGGIPQDRTISSSATMEGTAQAVRIGDQKLILDMATREMDCYDLSTDPGELQPHEPCDAIADSLIKFMSMPRFGNGRVHLGSEDREALNGLGYI